MNNNSNNNNNYDDDDGDDEVDNLTTLTKQSDNKSKKLEMMYKKFLNEYEDLNIQRLAVGEIRLVTIILYSSIGLSLIGVITMSVLLFYYLDVRYIIFPINTTISNENSTSIYNIGLSLKGIEGSMRTISSIISCLLYMTFPARIIGDSWERNQLPHVEQGLLLLLILIIMINPGYNPLNSCFYWIDFADDVAFAEGSPTLLSLASLTVRDFSSSLRTFFVRFSCVLSIASIYIYIGFISHAYGLAEKLKRKSYGYILEGDMISDIKTDATTTGAGNSTLNNVLSPFNNNSNMDIAFNSSPTLKMEKNPGNGLENIQEEIDNEVTYETEIEKNPQNMFPPNSRNMGTKAFSCGRKGWQCCRARCKGQCGGFFSQILEITPISFTVAVIIYCLISFGLSFGYNFTPSQIPFVAIITIMRVCFSGPSASTINGFEYVFEDPNEGDISEGSWCTKNYLPFSRAISGLVIVGIEFVLLAMTLHIIRKSRLLIGRMPYANTRGKQLGFIFFQTSTFVLFCFSILNGVILVSVPPIDYWIVTEMNITLDPSFDDVVSIRLVANPLFQLGVNLDSVGFGCFQLVVVVWLVVMAFAYLPPTSKGWFGWFCAGENPFPNEIDDQSKNYDVFVKKDGDLHGNGHLEEFITTVKIKSRRIRNSCLPEDVPLYLVSESEVSTLSDAMLPSHEEEIEATKYHSSNIYYDKALVTTSQKLTKLLSRRGFSMNSKSSFVASTRNLSGKEIQEKKKILALVDQLHANVFVLETEIVLYHFMHVVYEYGSYQGKSNLTIEEKQALIDDPRFKLIAHLENSLTDTHCLVAASDDRIIISFRGTVSIENMKTDWDSTLIVSEAASKVIPKLYPDDGLNETKQVLKPPLVHRGFMDAYGSIKDALHYCIENLLQENPNRVIFTTGHSLGGGLAVVCAIDIFVIFKPIAIGCTTWGCPKVGNFSFATRFNYAITCSRRFVCATDIITKIPFDPPFKDISLKGWWHVGTEILLDVNGNMIIRPAIIESFLIHGWRRFSTFNHPRSAYGCSLVVWCLRSKDRSWEPHWWKCVMENINKYGVPKRLNRVPTANRNELLEMLAKNGIAYSRGKFKYRNFGLQTEEIRSFNEDTESNHVSFVDPLPNGNVESVENSIDKNNNPKKSVSFAGHLEGPTTQDILKMIISSITFDNNKSSKFNYLDVRNLGEELIELSNKIESSKKSEAIAKETLDNDEINQTDENNFDKISDILTIEDEEYDDDENDNNQEILLV